jgi:hypothetical protein
VVRSLCKMPSRPLNYSWGFEKSVEETKQAVLADDGFVRERLPSSTQELKCVFRQFGITNKKTNETVVEGSNTSCTLKLVFSADGTGLMIRGSRSGSGKDSFYAIEEGFVAATGRAYWVERGKGDSSILVSGEFYGDDFSGEWLSSAGYRGRVDKLQPVSEHVGGQVVHVSSRRALSRQTIDPIQVV